MVVGDCLGRGPHINVAIQKQSNYACGLYRSIEPGSPITPWEVEDRRDRAYKREPKPKQVQQASLHVQSSRRLQSQLTSSIGALEIATPLQPQLPHKVMAPSTSHPPTRSYPHAQATQLTNLPLISLLHSQHCKINYSPVREPPAWRLDYKIGTGACGTVFLENVQTLGMKSPELWAVKRIPRALPNFTFKRYQAEIKNLQLLARVSFAWACSVILPALNLFNLRQVLSDI